MSSGRVLPQRYVSITSSRELLHSFSRPCRVRRRVITKMWIVCREGLGYSNCAFDGGFVTQLAKTLTIQRGCLCRCRQPVMELNCRHSVDPHQSLSDFHCSEKFRPLRNLTLSPWCTMLKMQFGVPQKIGLIPIIHHFPRIGHFRRKDWIPSPKVPSRPGRFPCKDGFLARKCLPSGSIGRNRGSL